MAATQHRQQKKRDQAKGDSLRQLERYQHTGHTARIEKKLTQDKFKATMKRSRKNN